MDNKALPENIKLKSNVTEEGFARGEEFPWKKILAKYKNDKNQRKDSKDSENLVQYLEIERLFLDLFPRSPKPIIHFFIDMSADKMPQQLIALKNIFQHNTNKCVQNIHGCKKIVIILRDTYTKVSFHHMTPERLSQEIVETLQQSGVMTNKALPLKIGHINKAMMGELNVLQFVIKNHNQPTKNTRQQGELKYEKNL